MKYKAVLKEKNLCDSLRASLLNDVKLQQFWTPADREDHNNGPKTDENVRL